MLQRPDQKNKHLGLFVLISLIQLKGTTLVRMKSWSVTYPYFRLLIFCLFDKPLLLWQSILIT